MSTPPADAGAEAADLRYVAERLLASVREDIGRADAKAAILLSGAVAFFAVMCSRAQGPAASSTVGTVLIAAGALLWLCGVAMLVGVVLPRTRTGADATFLRALAAGTSPEVLRVRLADAGADVVRWILGQASVLGAVLAAKYRWLRLGVCSLTLGAVLVLFGELW